MAYRTQRSCLINRAWVYILLIFFTCLGCFDQQAGGNSAESGNPELAGILMLKGKEPAVLARVQCVPSDFNVMHDTLPLFFKTTTDSLGHFSFDSLPKGEFSLEAYDQASGERLLIQNLEIDEDSVIEENLLPTGVLRIGVEDLDENDSGFVILQGTTLYRPVTVKYGTDRKSVV